MKKNYFLKIIFFLFFALIFPFFQITKAQLIFQGKDLSSYVLKEYQQKVEKALDNAGENSEELIKFLTSVNPEYKKGASFLLAYMPYADLIQIKSEVLLDNINYAYKSLEEFSWGKDLPEEIFLNYLLPYRNSQEPIENFRPYFFEKLSPLVKDLNSATEAAILVNRWVAERVKYKPTQREDQGPFQTLKGGYGRCEELVILYNDALRSIGIPARDCWTPYWATQDDNHAWTEIWIDSMWHYTGAAEPSDKLNQAWFDNVVKKASLVFSKPYGEPPTFEKKYWDERGELLVNSTDFYTQAGEFEIEITKEDNKAIDISVSFSVFNYGALRKIAWVKTDEYGQAIIFIGKGTYFICSGDGENYTWKVESIENNQKKKVILELNQLPKEKDSFWLRY
jgi:hypothetical protein